MAFTKSKNKGTKWTFSDVSTMLCDTYVSYPQYIDTVRMLLDVLEELTLGISTIDSVE